MKENAKEKTIEETIAIQSIENNKMNSSFNYTWEKLFETKWNIIRLLNFIKKFKLVMKITYYFSFLAESESIQEELFYLLTNIDETINELKEDKKSVDSLINITKRLANVYNMDCNERICALLDAIETKIIAKHKIITDEVQKITLQCDRINFLPTDENQELYINSNKKIDELSLSLGIKKS